MRDDRSRPDDKLGALRGCAGSGVSRLTQSYNSDAQSYISKHLEAFTIASVDPGSLELPRSVPLVVGVDPT